MTVVFTVRVEDEGRLGGGRQRVKVSGCGWAFETKHKVGEDAFGGT